MLGDKTKLKEEYAFSSSEDNLSRSSLGLRYHASMSVTCLFRVDSLSWFLLVISRIRLGQAVIVKQFQKLFMAGGSNIIPFLPSVHETIAVVAQVFPKRQPMLQEQGYTQMPLFLGDVEETSVSVPGTCAGVFVSFQKG